MAPLNLRSIQYFVAVAEELHFGRAAARLHIGQPPLSQQIRRLEGDLGVALFHRTRRKVEMTAAGRAFLDEARALLAQAERARAMARKAARGEIGQLAIGFVPSGNHALLTDLVSRFRRRYPEVVVTVQSLSTTAQLAALGEGRIQIGFVRMPVEASGLRVRSVWREPLVVAIKQSDPVARQPKVRVASLAPHPLLIFPRSLAPGFYDVIMRLFALARARPARVEEVEHVRTKLAMVAKGLGVAILPAAVTDLSHKGVVYRPLAGPRAMAETAVAYREDLVSDTAKAFLAALDGAKSAKSTASRTGA